MAIALVQTSSEIVITAGSGTPSVTLNVTAGSLLVAVMSSNNAGIPTLSDSKGNVWALDKNQTSANTGGAGTLVFSAPNCAAGSTVVTISSFGGANLNAKILEFSGVVSVSQVAVSGQDTDDTTSAPNAIPAPGLSIPANALGVTAFTFDRAVTGSGPANWTAVASASSTIYWAYRVYSGATSGERGAITASVGTHYESVLVAYNAVAASPTLTGNVTLDNAVAAGSFSSIASSLSGNVTLDDAVAAGVFGIAPGVLTIPGIKNNTGTLLAGVTLPNVVVLRRGDRAALLALTAQVINGSGALVIPSTALIPGTACQVVAFENDGSLGGCWPATVV